jgi:hypothetical protein
MAGLREWLEARGLGRYAQALLAQDIELDVLPHLTDADLMAAGLPVGARKRLLQATEALRNDQEVAIPRSAVSRLSWCPRVSSRCATGDSRQGVAGQSARGAGPLLRRQLPQSFQSIAPPQNAGSCG